MSETKMEDVELGVESTGWTRENLEKLLASLKDKIPENEKKHTYIRGLKAVDWDKVAFPPFSAQECQQKWNSMMGMMRRYRSLPELLDEAEAVFSHRASLVDIQPEHPKPPTPPKMHYVWNNMSKYKKKHPDLTIGQIVKMLSKKYETLPDEKKDKYVQKHILERDEYKRKKLTFR
ncbi:nucleolar transcription factor 1-B-like [Fundulus diaphanus]